MSDIGQTIDAIIRDGLGKPLKQDGYRKTGRTFHRVSDLVVRVVNVQGSQGNIGSTGRFYVNLGVYFPQIAKLLRKEIKTGSVPKEHECTIRRRIGELMPQPVDDQWDINPGADVASLAKNVERAWLDYGKPWIDQGWDNLKEAMDILARSHGYESAIAASVLLKEMDHARRLAQEGSDWIREANPRFAQMILSLPEELERKAGS